MPKSRNYTLTIPFEGEEEKQTILDNLKACTTGGIAGIEPYADGTSHLQVAIHFANQRSENAVRGLFPDIHVEIMQQPWDVNARYCSKGSMNHQQWEEWKRDGYSSESRVFDAFGVDADVYEWGTTPMSKKEQGEEHIMYNMFFHLSELMKVNTESQEQIAAAIEWSHADAYTLDLLAKVAANSQELHEGIRLVGNQLMGDENADESEAEDCSTCSGSCHCDDGMDDEDKENQPLSKKRRVELTQLVIPEAVWNPEVEAAFPLGCAEELAAEYEFNLEQAELRRAENPDLYRCESLPPLGSRQNPIDVTSPRAQSQTCESCGKKYAKCACWAFIASEHDE